MTMRKKCLGAAIALAFGLLWAVKPVGAQDPNQLAQLKISIWPEYDRPTVLVLLDGTLADKSNLPRQVAVLIPSGAELSVATWQNPDGSFAPEQSYQTVAQVDGYARVTFTIAQPTYRVEYYVDQLKGAPTKTLDFVFKSATAIAQVTLEIQQPLQATNFSISPPAQTSRSDSDGFKYLISQYSSLAAGQAITTQVKYLKTSSSPSVSSTPANALPTAPAPSSAVDPSYLIFLVVLVLAVALGFLLWQRRNQVAPVVQPISNLRRKQQGGAPVGVYCTQCGHALSGDDNYCSKCGTKRRDAG
jgi:hypothetical protein